MRKTGLHIAFALIILMIALPAVQMRLHLFEEKPLNGAFTLAEKPSFSKEKWNSGEFQADVESYLKDHSGFRNFFVRLQNQLEYSLFEQANAEGAVIGKNNQLFEYDYIRSWLATDFPGESFVEKKLRRTSYVQEYLKREKGIDLVVVFEPGKASFYPEYIPGDYARQKEGPSTYDLYLRKARELDIDFIDLQHYFLQLKPGSKYPLFPRYGTHWSVYGMWFAADSILRFIEGRRNISLTDVRVNAFETSLRPRDTDDDVINTMNLLLPAYGEELAYPVLSFDTAHPGEKPMVLVVADSYYWNIFNTRIPKYVFAKEAFWYFNSLVYPDNYIQPIYTSELNLQEEVENQQVIFLMVTERFLHKFDWTFIDQLYALYTPHWLRDPVYEKINDIMKNEPWYNLMIEKAAQQNISLEKRLIEEGKFLFHQDDTLAYMVNYGPEYFKQIIEYDTGWMAYIREKALTKNISYEEMLQLDALYVFEKDLPGPYALNRGLETTVQQIQADPGLLESVTAEAESYRLEPASFIRLKAWQLYKEQEILNISHAIRSDANWLSDVRKKATEKGISLEEMIHMDAIYVWEQRMKVR